MKYTVQKMNNSFFLKEDNNTIARLDNKYTASVVCKLLNRKEHEIDYWKGQAGSPLNSNRIYTEVIEELKKELKKCEERK